MKRFLQIISYILVAAIASAVTMGCMVLNRRVSKLDRLETLISERFIGESDPVAMEDAAAAAMVESLGDRWSHYIPATTYVAYQEQMNNAYVGIGITIITREGGEGYLVQIVNSGGPADEAGMLAGDILVAVDGKSLADVDIDGTQDLVRGESGTTVVLTVLRGEETLELEAVRGEVKTPVALGRMLEDGIGYVQIANFDSRCAEESIAAIEELLAQGAEKLIFDVRYNPGGYADELVELLDYLLPEGELFRTVDYKGTEHIDRSDAKCLDIPMAVLVNGESYSAAEFFAAALSEYDAAFVVGTQTCGKGYFQYTFKLGDGSAVGISVGKYFTPKGVSLAGVGITPDYVVEVDDETRFAIYAGILAPEDDPQIQTAVKSFS